MPERVEIPILKVGDNLLISIQVDMTDEMATRLQGNILNRLVATGARGVLIDISTLDMVDSFLGRTFTETAQMAATMNAVVVIAGMQPAVALTLVELGLEMRGVHTALNVDRGMDLLESLKRKSSEG